MKFKIGSLNVLFPYEYIYPEQYEYMRDIKKAMDCEGPCLLEMPSGTGKTVSLLSVIVAYILQGSATRNRRLIYCSRTVPEIEKVLLELHNLMDYRKNNNNNNNNGENNSSTSISSTDRGDEDHDNDENKLAQRTREERFLGIGLTSRKNLCINPTVANEKWGRVVDAKCRALTVSWARNKAEQSGNKFTGCKFYENLEEQQTVLPAGVFTLESLKNWGRENKICPYFLARRALSSADVIVYSYHYLLDPKIAEIISRQLGKDTIVVFDEAHNIDNVCIESMSVDISRNVLESSGRCIKLLSERIEEIKKTDADVLKTEYDRLIKGLRQIADDRDANETLGNPVVPDSILLESVPGNIRKAEHFVAFLRRFIEYMKTRLKVLHVVAETPTSFLQHLREITYIEKKPLQFCAERLSSLIRTLEITNLEEFTQLNKIALFATLVSSYSRGFMLIFEPYESDSSTVLNPIFHLTCLDASLAMQPTFKRFPTVIITSGTLSPLEIYPQMLQFTPIISKSYPMTLSRACFCPLVIARGSDQVAISSKFEVRNDPAVVRNFGQILIQLSKCVPDGIVCFFPSYIYMESIVTMWNDMGLLNQVWRHKLIFLETPDSGETSLALENYRAACDNGRGAVLLSVARGKVSEGIDFNHHYGRAVIMFGIPYQYTESRILKARLEYLREQYQIRENDFLSFDALRHAAQCVGRVLRGKTDYGLMIFADKRYARADKRTKLPKWITAGFTEGTTNLSTDIAISITKKFLRTIAQPLDIKSQLGISLWTVSDVERVSNLHNNNSDEELEEESQQFNVNIE